MKFSLTLILSCLIIFISSCSMSQRRDFVEPDINLKIKTTNKNKEIIIQSLLKDGDIFSISFGDEDSYVLANNILNSDLKYFCKSLIEEEREVLEKNIFKSKKDVNKKVIVVFSENYENIASFLKNKYPEEEYFMIMPENFDTQIKEILNVDLSIENYNDLSKFDTSLKISHSPRIRDDIGSIYYITDYDVGKTIVPIFRSYALNMDTFSSSEIFHDANDIKKLVDFENTYIPITKKMIENISKKQDPLIKSEIENSLIRDFLIIEKVFQNNLFKENLLPISGNKKIKRSGCMDRNLNLWKVSTADFTY
ncbi:MAG: hypothetical protein EVA93_00530 [SAR86 cluster bacterium]|uniref:Uncharacterized protein n=1 Tax=SAR86 cluster bacterium TaxID=2030880 RepID=A0A520N4J9_9GAMM|nr:MAG: hypothetical protein EVA93_00530 [SAR86 cluster bacterium]